MSVEMHTPGPYRAGRYSSLLGCPVMAQPNPTENSIVICSVYGGLGNNSAARKVECEATATLFAAAPDLLKVARYAKDIQADVFRGAVDPVTALDAIVDLADAAISRATGA